MAFCKNMHEFLNGLRREHREVTRQLTWTLKHTTTLLHEEITARTPVNTGLTIGNYVWSMDAPVIQTIEPIPSGAPEGTNAMPLGPEPRRAANLEVATMTLHDLEFENPFRRYYLTNTGPAIDGLEHGLLPSEPGFTPRSPQGMFRVSIAYVYALLEAGHI